MDRKFQYLPTAYNFKGMLQELERKQELERETEREQEQEPEPAGEYPCPCCGCLTLPVPAEEAIAHICPVCFWENDVFTHSDDEPSDENGGMTLNEGRENYRRLGACQERLLPHVRPPRPEEIPK